MEARIDEEEEYMNLVFLLEEKSMKEVLDRILPQILPSDVSFLTLPHEGKSDLQASIKNKLQGWNIPDTRFVIVQDKDTGDCVELKRKLVSICEKYNHRFIVRIACNELESWYFGDLTAVAKAYNKKGLERLSLKSKYRVPDEIENPKDELKKLIPGHRQIDGARRISEYMDIENNSSHSFNVFVQGVRKLCM